jgi:protein-S-isoprenylcysteine O-methyltransferase Ste14
MSLCYVANSMPDDAKTRYAGSLAFAWAGAAVFGVSLVYAAYSYAVLFDRLQPRFPWPVALACNTALFATFALHHSLLARPWFKSAVARWTTPEIERSIYTWTASLLFLATCWWWQPIAVTLYALDQPWRGAGYLVQTAGVILTIHSSARLDVFDLAGVRQVQQARGGAVPRHVALETSGVYGFVRHPLYFAWILLVFGAPVMTGTRLAFAVLSTGYLAIAIPWEEQSLIRIFGVDYEAYRRQVRWRMLPGIY